MQAGFKSAQDWCSLGSCTSLGSCQSNGSGTSSPQAVIDATATAADGHKTAPTAKPVEAAALNHDQFAVHSSAHLAQTDSAPVGDATVTAADSILQVPLLAVDSPEAAAPMRYDGSAIDSDAKLPDVLEGQPVTAATPVSSPVTTVRSDALTQRVSLPDSEVSVGVDQPQPYSEDSVPDSPPASAVHSASDSAQLQDSQFLTADMPASSEDASVSSDAVCSGVECSEQASETGLTASDLHMQHSELPDGDSSAVLDQPQPCREEFVPDSPSRSDFLLAETAEASPATVQTTVQVSTDTIASPAESLAERQSQQAFTGNPRAAAAQRQSQQANIESAPAMATEQISNLHPNKSSQVTLLKAAVALLLTASTACIFWLFFFSPMTVDTHVTEVDTAATGSPAGASHRRESQAAVRTPKRKPGARELAALGKLSVDCRHAETV